MRDMFPHVEALIRLLLVNPAFSATAEKSFSSLPRLKTYLRSSCGQQAQQRLNDLAICHVHKDIMDDIDVKDLMKEFVLTRDKRSQVFGQIDKFLNPPSIDSIFISFCLSSFSSIVPLFYSSPDLL